MNNDKVLIYASIGISYPVNQYAICRNEGRIPVNIGFGLMELGYDVNIVSPNFNEIIIDRCCESVGKVTLSQHPIYEKYDFSLSWGATPGNVSIKKEINFINYSHEIKGITHLTATFVTPYKQLVQSMIEESGKPVEYLPPLVPITTYNLGFKEFNYNLKNNYLKIFVYISSWERITLCITETELVIQEIKDMMKEKNIKIKLYIQIHNEEIKRDIKNIISLGDEIEFINTMNYDEYLQMIENIDIFILKGNQFMASAGMYDIVALGKPMMYISENLHLGNYRNPLFQNTKEITFSGDNVMSIKRQVNDFISNPKRKYDLFREYLKDSNFENWKEHALKIFSL